MNDYVYVIECSPVSDESKSKVSQECYSSYEKAVAFLSGRYPRPEPIDTYLYRTKTTLYKIQPLKVV